ncbi:flagellar hook-basal body complex protein [Novosphingobium sp. FGD1]|jgi:flagellar hook protein FlgE|uniref:Flagellar hook protein FlgE n=1 Tax=Novosphingobium silvae TaxID=2692619 RepID=A0A7X4GFY5_9SPHN|nr:flagellar hook basal-body protein [Novosphingobium silvae]MYL97531.1 flagellar hook-basal body complex protein [Novosphingobium silvae]
MSYYTSLTGLKNAQTELNVIAHNIANAETTGFKKSDTAFADIVSSSVITDPALTVGIGSRVSKINQEFSLGPIEQTGSALDLALDGEGFFTVRNPQSGQTEYTRAGGFTVDGQGFLKNAQNARLQVFPVNNGVVDTASLQSVQIPATNAAGSAYASVVVNSDGHVVATYDDGSNAELGVVAVANFIAPDGLKQMGSATWQSTGKSGMATYGQPGTGVLGGLMSGSLERSNVDIAEELVELISAQRYFQANAKAIDTATQISQTVINLRN